IVDAGETTELGHGRRTSDEIARGLASSQSAAGCAKERGRHAGQLARSRAELSQAQGGGDAAGSRRLFRLCAGEERARSAAEGADRGATPGGVKSKPTQHVETGRRHGGRRRSSRIRLSDGNRGGHPGARRDAQRRHVDGGPAPPYRTGIDQSSGGYRRKHFGNWVLLMPTKLGGGTYAVNLNTGRTLAWISYWNYGDYNPISHHLCAFPSADPTKGFEWVNSTQGGKNSLIYGIPTNIETPAEGFNIYRVRYDGAQMEVMENVAEATGLGLGVHVTIDPKTAERYFVTDGQKDIAACFDRRTSRVIAARKYDWVPNVRNLAEGWQKGGVLKISRIYPDEKTGKYDYLGTKGQKIEWEMVPMGELFVEEGTLPGDDVLSLCGADGTIWHPSGRWASTIVRLCGGQLILDAEKNFEPVNFLQFNKNAPNQYPVKKIDNDHWEVTFDKIFSPGHEIGFSPDGRFLCMMNNLRENNCSVFDSSDPDPRNWKKIAHIEDPLWVGKYPNPFHMVFSMDGAKLYLSILHPSPAASGVMVVDTKTWKIKKEIQGIGPDMQTLAVTYDGKYVVGVFSGFQRLSSGIAFIDTETDELVGIWPSNGGHHDCVIVPRTLEHMKHTRSCTL